MRMFINITMLFLIYNIMGIIWMWARIRMKKPYALEYWNILQVIGHLWFWPISIVIEIVREIRSYINK